MQFFIFIFLFSIGGFRQTLMSSTPTHWPELFVHSTQIATRFSALDLGSFADLIPLW